jgi:hypothetical protein
MTINNNDRASPARTRVNVESTNRFQVQVNKFYHPT